jgi:hypothetical protein
VTIGQPMRKCTIGRLETVDQSAHPSGGLTATRRLCDTALVHIMREAPSHVTSATPHYRFKHMRLSVVAKDSRRLSSAAAAVDGRGHPLPLGSRLQRANGAPLFHKFLLGVNSQSEERLRMRKIGLQGTLDELTFSQQMSRACIMS